MAKSSKSLANGKTGQVLPPPPPRIGLELPRSLNDIKGIRAEMARVYRGQFDGKVAPEDATKLIFILNIMVQAVRHEAEMAELQKQYQDAWSGVGIIAPAGGPALPVPAPHVEIIPPAQQSEEIEHET